MNRFLPVDSTKQGYFWSPPLHLAVLLILYSGVFLAAWVGYIGSDDWVYIQSARDRMHDPFVVATNHWQARLTLTWPMALAFKLFGESEYSAALPTLMYTFFTGTIVFVFLVNRMTRFNAYSTAALVATSPLLAIMSTSLRIDAVELFFVTGSLLAFLRATENKHNRKLLLVVAGISAGLAFSTRPTSIALVCFYALLFIVRYKIQRLNYFLIAAGFTIIWGAESLYYLAKTGDFFYRLTIDFNHDHVVRGGTLFNDVVISPVKMALLSHGIGLTFWCFPFAVWHLSRNQNLPAKTRSLTLFFAFFSLVWISVFSMFSSKLVLDPRYLAPSVLAALVVLGFWVANLVKNGNQKAAYTLFGCLVSINALGIYLDNKNFLYAERWLVQLAQSHDKPIYTDPQTYERALFLLELNGVKKRVIPTPAPVDGLFLAVPENSARGSYNTARWNPTDYNIGNWPQMAKLDPGPTGIGILLNAWGLRSLFPMQLWKKIAYPNPAIYLYMKPAPTELRDFPRSIDQ